MDKNPFKNYRNFDRIDGELMEFEWNIFPGFNTLQLSEEVKSLLYKLGDIPEKSQEEFFLCRCSTTFPLERKTMRKNVWHTLESYLCMQGSLDKDTGHSLVLVYPITEDILQGIWDKIAERMLLEFAESGCPFFRATTPLSRGHFRSKGGGKMSIHYCADLDTVRTLFRTLISANQLTLRSSRRNV